MQYYDIIARSYEELYKEEQLKKIKIIKKHLKVKPNYKLLDVGCGIGISTEPWRCKRYGIDTSKELLRRAKKKNQIKYKLAPAEAIPYPNNFFDIVISVTSIQNFKDIEKALREIKRVGKNKFVLTILKKSPKWESVDKLIRRYFRVNKIIEEKKDFIYFCSN